MLMTKCSYIFYIKVIESVKLKIETLVTFFKKCKKRSDAIVLKMKNGLAYWVEWCYNDVKFHCGGIGVFPQKENQIRRYFDETDWYTVIQVFQKDCDVCTGICYGSHISGCIIN